MNGQGSNYVKVGESSNPSLDMNRVWDTSDYRIVKTRCIDKRSAT